MYRRHSQPRRITPQVEALEDRSLMSVVVSPIPAGVRPSPPGRPDVAFAVTIEGTDSTSRALEQAAAGLDVTVFAGGQEIDLGHPLGSRVGTVGGRHGRNQGFNVTANVGDTPTHRPAYTGPVGTLEYLASDLGKVRAGSVQLTVSLPGTDLAESAVATLARVARHTPGASQRNGYNNVRPYQNPLTPPQL
jgi:hypothetical protein